MPQPRHPFLELLEQHSAAIDRICRSFCHGNREDMEDLRQDIVVNLWQGWQHYHPENKPITWVWRIAVNTGISWYRHQKRQPEITPIESVLLPTADTKDLETLYSLIQQLPLNDQHLLQLYLDGWSHTEIATMLHTSQTNVQTRLYRIRQKMKVGSINSFFDLKMA